MLKKVNVLSISLLVLLSVASFVWPGPASVEAMTLYDDFSGNLIDTNRWDTYEFVREIQDNRLISKVVTIGGLQTNNLTIKTPSPVAEIDTDITIVDVQSSTPGAGQQTSAGARISGYFYNDGTGSSGSTLGEVQGVIFLGTVNGGSVAQWIVCKMNAAGSCITLNYANLPIGISLGTTYNVSLKWESGIKRFTFSVNGTSQTWTSSDTTVVSPYSSNKSIGTYTNTTPGTSLYAEALAAFDNVTVKDGSGNVLWTDDFSSPVIDATKWSAYDFAREQKNGSLRERVRIPAGTPNDTVQSNLTFPDPDNINEIQADVTVTSFNNAGSETPRVTLNGRFYNDGTGSTGSYIGDIGARVVIGGSGTAPVGQWNVQRYTSATDSGAASTLGSGTFTLTPSLDTSYNLYLHWDGSSFTFKINGETHTYTPASPYLPAGPPNMPWKALQTRIATTHNAEASVAALYDNVWTDYPKSFLTASVNTDAGGTVTCTPNPVVNGSTASCTITTNAGYVLQSISGCGGSLTDSTFTTGAMNGACAIKATFYEHPLRRYSGPTCTGYYDTIHDAYAVVSPGETLAGLNTVLSGDVLMDRPIGLKFSGGYNSTFSNNTGGFTTIGGKLTIRDGTVTVEKLMIQ
jgi:hypothetical protein